MFRRILIIVFLLIHVAQVLANTNHMQLTDLEWSVLHRLKRYSKPVKTKHLAARLKISRPEIVAILNKLLDNKLIYWHVPGKRDDHQWYGWKCL